MVVVDPDVEAAIDLGCDEAFDIAAEGLGTDESDVFRPVVCAVVLGLAGGTFPTTAPELPTAGSVLEILGTAALVPATPASTVSSSVDLMTTVTSGPTLPRQSVANHCQ